MLIAGLVLIVGACGTSYPTTRPAQTSATADPTSSPAPSDLIGLIATPTPAPSLTSMVAAAPTPGPASRWTKPHQVGTIRGCSTLTSAIDSASRYHVAAECSGSIHYYVSSDRGHSWTHTLFTHPAHRQDHDPQIAFRGDTVYVAYSRTGWESGDCGSPGDRRDVAVYIRSRTQPEGAWSAPVRIGSFGDSLRSLQVYADTVQATVTNKGRDVYETIRRSTVHRFRVLAGASLGGGGDGRAWIAYSTPRGIEYGAFTGAGFSRTRIPGTINRDVDPRLVLDAQDDAHIVWTRLPTPPVVCGAFTYSLKDYGTYYATNATGPWKAHRITTDVGETSLQVDPGSGTVHVVVGDAKLKYYTTAAGGTWRATTLVPATIDSPTSPLLRLDPATGSLLVVYLGGRDGTRIFALTKP